MLIVDGLGKNFNQYTVSMEMMLDELPQAPTLTAIFNTGMYNEKPANIYVRYLETTILLFRSLY